MLKTKRQRPKVQTRSTGVVTLDFEWYCAIDLKKYGLYRVVKHPSFEPLCLAFSACGLDLLWLPGDPCPPLLVEAIRQGCEFHAHNAAAERLVWEEVMVKRYGWPAIPRSLWRCTAAKAAHANLPRKLERTCHALDLDPVDQKDSAGHKVMLKLSKPDGKGRRLLPTIENPRPVRPAKQTPNQRLVFTRKVRTWKHRQAQRTAMFDALYRYCQQDVHAEKLVDELALPMTKRELAIWQLDQKINDCGVPVDMGLCQGANDILETALKLAAERLVVLTQGAVAGVNQTAKLMQWLRDQGVSERALPNLRKQTVADYLKREGFDPTVKEVLNIKHKAGLASVKKMRAAYNWADDDCRCRGTLNYYAASTGRWGGRGPQFQNMVRAKTPPPEILAALSEGVYAVVASMLVGDGEYNKFNSIIAAVAGATRSIITAPPGRKLVISDFASIEARVLHWLFGDEDTLQRFRDGVDLYVLMASKIYNVPADQVTKDQRQIGKIAVLALGYGQGPGDPTGEKLMGFQSSCKNMGGVEVPYEFAATVVEVYRRENKAVVDGWRDMERAARYCVKTGKTVRCGRVKFHMLSVNGQRWLALRLPSGRDLYYHKPGIGINRFDKPCVYYWGVRKGKYCKIDLYGGLIVENIVQAIARDLLADALLAIDGRLGADAHLIMHVHDETVTECDEADMETEKLVHACMTDVPDWAAGLPIAAETHTCKRYEK